MLESTVPVTKGLLCFIFIVSFVILILFYTNDTVTTETLIQIKVPDAGFLVYNSKCKIPDTDPWNPDAKRFYKIRKYKSCRTKSLLTYVTKTDNIATLHVDTQIVPSYTKHKLKCCYSNVTRVENKNSPDNSIKIYPCAEFEDNVTTVDNVVLVKCTDEKSKKEVYANVHSIFKVTDEVKEKVEKLNDSKPISVIFIGIDSISRLNLIRSLPSTYRFLEDNDWISLKGYNKVDDNTFPNVMAMMTGFNESQAFRVCKPRSKGGMDKCPLLWYDFRRLGYVTGYAEDAAQIGTFNYKKEGFTNEPTDYYFRTYTLATEHLKTNYIDGILYCTGPETAGERIMNVIRDFSIELKDMPKFGFFWMNTFSHQNLNSPSGMDKKVKEMLVDLTNSGVMNESIVIFLSDHGIRFGDFRYTQSGWLEERLPYIYFSIPKSFQQKYPDEYLNLKENTYKFTCPYDVYMTLQHIIKLSGLDYEIKPSNACPLCKSLFERIPDERSCEDANIEPHWCTCQAYELIESKPELVMEAINYVLDEIQQIIIDHGSESKCAKYSVKKVISSSISTLQNSKNETYLRLLFTTNPQASFEATLRIVNIFENSAKKRFVLTGNISRLDLYSSTSRCIEDAMLKKYCNCVK